MANEVRITVGADTKKADKAVKSFGDRLKDMSGKAKIAGASLSAMGVGGIAAIKGFTDAAMEQVRAEKLLESVITAAGESYQGQVGNIMAVTAALQAKTNYGDEEQLAVLSKLVPVLGSTELALNALPAIMDLAATTGEDFGAVAKRLGPVLAGATNNVASLGLKFEESQGPAERTAILLGLVGGAAEANADPMMQMKNDLGDISQAIGKELLPLLIPMIDKIRELALRAQNINPIFFKIAAVTLAVATAFGVIGGPILLIIGFLPALTTGFVLLAGAMGPITVVVLALTAAIAAGLLIYRNWGNITDWIGDRIANMQRKIKPLVDAISGLIKKIKELIRIIADSPVGAFLGKTAGFLGGAASAVGGLFTGGRMGFASGGMVPGPEGAPRMAVVHGGEMILNRGQQQSGGFGGVTINITGNHITGEIELDRIVRRAITSAGVRGAL